MRKIKNLKSKIQNSWIALLLFIASSLRRKPKSADLNRLDFSTSTQKLGVSFTDKIRNIFRHRWLKKS